VTSGRLAGDLFAEQGLANSGAGHAKTWKPVEIRDVILLDGMKRAMAGQAESERERRAKKSSTPKASFRLRRNSCRRRR
jgi:hypothetical protein